MLLHYEGRSSNKSLHPNPFGPDLPLKSMQLSNEHRAVFTV
jgi:hypothetical protein